MHLKDCIYDGSGKFRLKDHPTSANIPEEEKDDYVKRMQKNTERIEELLNRLYAESKEGLLIVFQALDAAGKDSTIKHVMRGVNPQHVVVQSFKTPSKEEAAHDFLWRESKALAQRGMCCIFNRSHYEECLAVRVHKFWKDYAMPSRIIDMSEEDYFDVRYRACVAFEDNLYYNGYRVIKFYLNVGLDEQKNRFLERMDNPAKHWKFSATDLDERELYPEYQEAFEDTIQHTATKRAPWYIIPADQKFYMRWLVSEAIVKTLEDMDPQYPDVSDAELARYATCREKLGE